MRARPSLPVRDQAQIISINSIKAKREAAKADFHCAVFIIEGTPSQGDIVLCELNDGTLALGWIAAIAKENGYVVQSPRNGEIKSVIGRAVHVTD